MALAFSTSIFPCNSSSSTEFRDSSFRFPLSFHGSRSSIVFSDSKASTVPLRAARELRRRRCAGEKNSSQNSSADEQEEDLGVKAALSLLRLYKREISPLLPSSCRYVPTCSEYSMAAYKKYGVIKGTILTAWRLCRCNPLGGSGFDPPRWFDEPRAPLE
ncbi:uncharacterized protein LOC116254584 isoform X1 [Nymphaea colorata]|nr:uncharacterized protein LOC116254584 isoform X1 [Nymphaea colorata]XP_049933908.1 uncharacterized protein LOC116254584 isoform X1 [Nymphaea colorata]